MSVSSDPPTQIKPGRRFSELARKLVPLLVMRTRSPDGEIELISDPEVKQAILAPLLEPRAGIWPSLKPLLEGKLPEFGLLDELVRIEGDRKTSLDLFITVAKPILSQDTIQDAQAHRELERQCLPKP